MSSETSTDTRRRQDADSGLHPRHLYLLLSMIGATVAVVVVGRSHPLALILLSLTVVAAGFVGLALQGALTGFFGLRGDAPARSERETSALEREKAMVLRSLKELEFDRAMKKIDDADFAKLNAGLRARAIALMEALDHEKTERRPSSPAGAIAGSCAKCGTKNDADARFCKSCGDRL